MTSEAAFHRKIREQFLDGELHAEVHKQFLDDISWGLIISLPIFPALVDRVSNAFLQSPADVFLRAGDAVHFGSAAEAGFKEIYSNDRHRLAAAPIFNLKGIDPLAK
jgi:hypothetical protein